MTTAKICSIEGCGKPVVGRGWCSKHWQRWKTHGDPLITRKSANGTHRRFYQETVLPYTGDDCLTWPFHRDKQGYARGSVGLSSDSVLVHRQACIDRNGPPPFLGAEASHECGGGARGCVAPG